MFNEVEYRQSVEPRKKNSDLSTLYSNLGKALKYFYTYAKIRP